MKTYVPNNLIDFQSKMVIVPSVTINHGLKLISILNKKKNIDYKLILQSMILSIMLW